MNADVRRHERLLRFALEHLLMLPLGALIALAWVNTAPESDHQFALAAAFTVNDLAMVFFFGIIMKEVVEATVPGGYGTAPAATGVAADCCVCWCGRCPCAAVHPSRRYS